VIDMTIRHTIRLGCLLATMALCLFVIAAPTSSAAPKSELSFSEELSSGAAGLETFWHKYKWTALAAGAVIIGQSLLIGGLLMQRRRRQRTEVTLRDLSGRLLSAQEEERRRIARELHDNVSQQMALLSIEITQVTKALGAASEPLARSIRELSHRAGMISSEIHGLSHRLHSSRLEALGLAEAVRGHCDELCAQGVHASFYDENVPRSLPHSVELCLFRIVQEGLNNVVKHSGAREAQVALRAKGEVIQLTIADFGHGFDERNVKVTSGLGLASMRERLRLIHGEFDIRSEPGQGTTIIARVPIRDVGGPTSDEGVCVA